MESSAIYQRLLQAEEEFLAVRDSAALETFSSKWASLCDDVEHAFSEGDLDPSTISLAQSTAHKVATLGDSLATLQEQSEQAMRMDDIERMLAEMTIDDLHTSGPAPTPSRRKSRSSSDHRSPQPPPAYIPEAYEWLLCNAHNPYPNGPCKRQLAKQSRLSLRSIETWFKNARRHIGWVSLCKAHFNGSRSLAVAAAERVLSGERSGLPHRIATEFTNMLNRLQTLYVAERTPQYSPSWLEMAPESLPCLRPATSPTHLSPLLATSSVSHNDFSSSGGLTSSPSSPASTPHHPPSLVFSSSDSEEEGLCEPSSETSYPDTSLWTKSTSQVPLSISMKLSQEQHDELLLHPHIFTNGSLDLKPLSVLPPQERISYKTGDNREHPLPKPSRTSRKRRRSDDDTSAATKRFKVDSPQPLHATLVSRTDDTVRLEEKSHTSDTLFEDLGGAFSFVSPPKTHNDSYQSEFEAAAGQFGGWNDVVEIYPLNSVSAEAHDDAFGAHLNLHGSGHFSTGLPGITATVFNEVDELFLSLLKSSSPGIILPRDLPPDVCTFTKSSPPPNLSQEEETDINRLLESFCSPQPTKPVSVDSAPRHWEEDWSLLLSGLPGVSAPI